MDKSFAIADDFLTGSYKRWTKTKPLKDVDIFCVFADSERARYRTDKSPSIILADTEKVLAAEVRRRQCQPVSLLRHRRISIFERLGPGARDEF